MAGITCSMTLLLTTERISSRSDLQPGDLIFIRSSSGSIYHVGVYAGNGKFWHSPKSGDHVRLAVICDSPNPKRSSSAATTPSP